MNKFLKAIKVILLVALVIGGIALVVCFIVKPDETKELLNYVMDHLNKPLPIIGVSILTLWYAISSVISRSSIGKKSLTKITKDFDELKEETKHNEELAQEYYEKCLKKDDELKVILNSYSSSVDTLKEYVVKVCQTSPNAKIKALSKDILGDIKEIDTNMKNELEQINGNYEEYKKSKLDEQEIMRLLESHENAIKRLVDNYGKEETNN